MDTIWFGSATMRPENGPDSNVRTAAKPAPDATSSRGIARMETVCLESASVGCQAGITDVASSKEDASAGEPLPGGAVGDPDGHATSVSPTPGVREAAGTGDGIGGATGSSKAP